METVVTAPDEATDLLNYFAKMGIKTNYIDNCVTPQEHRYIFGGGFYTDSALKRAMQLLNNAQGYYYEKNAGGGFTVIRQRDKRQFITNGNANYELHKIVPDTTCAEYGKCYMAFGMGANGFVIRNLEQAAHVLIAGTTGSGKSCLLNSLIMQLLCFSTANLILLDPKHGAEFGLYERDIHNRICHIAKDTPDGFKWLRIAYNTMEKRYKQMDGVTKHYDGKKLVIVIDELADLMMTDKAIETTIIQIAQKGRAAGVHLIIATQDPRASIVTGLIKYNMPTKICLATANARHSMNMLDCGKAAQLLGKGDAYIKLPGSVELHRIQCPSISDDEIINCLTH